MTILSLFDDLENNPVKFINDPVAVAIVRSEGDGSVMMLDIDRDKHLPPMLELEGYNAKAKQIREYYQKRLFFGAMNNKFSSTGFRGDLQVCLEREDIHNVLANEVGMLARLPDFYEEDTTRDILHKECKGNKPTTNSFWADELTVKYLTKTKSRHGRNRQYCYWFKKGDRALCFYIEGVNPLINLLDDLLEVGKAIQLEGGFTTRVQDGFHFYQGKCKVLV
tara:strand:+ start:111 stop:776 length:666 start_codon:yes stop_codon:yes gene_type:complete